MEIAVANPGVLDVDQPAGQAYAIAVIMVPHEASQVRGNYGMALARVSLHVEGPRLSARDRRHGESS
eukprot:scaffold700_cov560-Prasinococcus_capsulatus_cf.AAC.19